MKNDIANLIVFVVLKLAQYIALFVGVFVFFYGLFTL